MENEIEDDSKTITERLKSIEDKINLIFIIGIAYVLYNVGMAAGALVYMWLHS